MSAFVSSLKNHFLPKPKFTPVFLIGCGRSGTTIIGNTIGKHQNITYLNERRDIWHAAYPELDIWNGTYKHPKLILKKGDVNAAKSNSLRKLFYKEQLRNRSSVLLEKLPINNFRLEFIQEIFPEARFIYLHRNGLEVATSIRKKADVRPWFGKHNQKWQLLWELGKKNVKDLPNHEFSNLEKGLLEWRLSIEESEMFFSKISPQKFFSLSYHSFIENPADQINSIYNFLEIESDSQTIQHFVKDISRKSEKQLKVDESLLAIGGLKLQLSVDNKLR